MNGTRRHLAAVALTVCLAGTQWTETLFASGADASSSSPAALLTSPVGSAEAQPMPATRVGSLEVGEETLRALNVSSAAPFAVNGSETLGTSQFAQWGRYRARGRRNGAAQAEMVLGAVATIAGAAVLTYANRPECSADFRADGCSYGTKVIGASVAAAGIVTFLTGALTWR